MSMSDPVLVKPWPRKLCVVSCAPEETRYALSVLRPAWVQAKTERLQTDLMSPAGQGSEIPCHCLSKGAEKLTDRPLDFINFSHFVVSVV